MGEYKFEIYKDKAGEHRWRFLAPNGNILAVSSESYHNKGDCCESLERLRHEALNANVIDVTKN